MEKDRFCAKANIVNLDPVSHFRDNVIRVTFKLGDKKFQRCFTYFKITVEKKRKVLKEVKVPYLHDGKEEISYEFKNIPCGIYEVFVQPCFDCPLFRWLYQKSINVTSNDCIDILQIKNVSDENDKSVALIIICVLIPLTFGILYYIYKRGLSRQEYMRISAAAKNEDLGEERISILFFIFSKCYKGDIMKNIINNFIAALETRLPDIFHNITQRYLKICIATIDSEIAKPECLDNVDKWLNNALKKKGKDGILQRCILIESSKKMDEDDVIENELFSYIQSKVRNRLEVFDNLFVAHSDDLTTYSEELTMKNIQTINSHDSHHFLNFCLDICSEFVVPQTRKSCLILYIKNSEEEKELSAFQNLVNFFRKHLCEIIC